MRRSKTSATKVRCLLSLDTPSQRPLDESIRELEKVRAMADTPNLLRRPISIPSSGLMTAELTGEYLSMSRAKFYRKLKDGKGPPKSEVVSNRWLIDDVEKWLGKAA